MLHDFGGAFGGPAAVLSKGASRPRAPKVVQLDSTRLGMFRRWTRLGSPQSICQHVAYRGSFTLGFLHHDFDRVIPKQSTCLTFLDTNWSFQFVPAKLLVPRCRPGAPEARSKADSQIRSGRKGPYTRLTLHIRCSGPLRRGRI